MLELPYFVFKKLFRVIEKFYSGSVTKVRNKDVEAGVKQGN